jgi:hypothetical protein
LKLGDKIKELVDGADGWYSEGKKKKRERERINNEYKNKFGYEAVVSKQ